MVYKVDSWRQPRCTRIVPLFCVQADGPGADSQRDLCVVSLIPTMAQKQQRGRDVAPQYGAGVAQGATEVTRTAVRTSSAALWERVVTKGQEWEGGGHLYCGHLCCRRCPA